MTGEVRGTFPPMRRGRRGDPDYFEEYHAGPSHRADPPASTVSGLGATSEQRGGDGNTDRLLREIEAE